MYTKRLIALCAMLVHFQPMLMASDEMSPIERQVRDQLQREFENSVCCRITRCQLRPYEEQYGDDSLSPYENCYTPRNAAQTTLRFITCPLMVVGIVTCVPLCIEGGRDCYISYRIRKAQREIQEQHNLEQDNLARIIENYANTPDNLLTQAHPTDITTRPQATVILHENMAIATAATDADRHCACASIISIRPQIIQDQD